MPNSNKNIDLVYLWVDGNDPVWLQKMQSYKDIPNSDIAGRFISHDELKYSLRSVEKHLPWVRKIFIVTDNQKPEWLNVNHPKIQLIDHKEIIPPHILPNFNSVVIEMFIHNIPGLSERYLYVNDDMFVNANLSPSFFFDEKTSFPIVRLQHQFMQLTELKLKMRFNIHLNNYRWGIYNAIRLIKNKFGKYYPGVLHHNIDAYLKDDVKKAIEVVFKDEFEVVFKNRFKHPDNIGRLVLQLYALTQNRAILHYTNRNESCRIRVHRPNFMDSIDRFNPKLFCLNDTEYATDEDRARIKPFLETLFPEKSSFEL